MSLKGTPRPDQIADLAFFINNPKAPLLHDPGCGKTVTAALWTQYAWDYHGYKTWWVQPLSLMKKNRLEIARFTNIPLDKIVILDGGKADRERLMRSDATVFLSSATCFSREWKYMYEHQPKFRNVVGDEIHLLWAGHDSSRSTEMYDCIRKMWGFIPMTGTIIKGKLSSAFPIINAIAPQIYGSYQAFMNFHADVDEYGRVVCWKNHEKLTHVLGALGIRRSFKSIYGDEAKVIQVEVCEMHPKQRKAYDELKTMGVLELDESFLEAGEAGVKRIRLRQIMAHPERWDVLKEGDMTGKDERMWIHIEDAIQSGEPLAIFASLVPEVERIYKQLLARGLKAGMIHGGVAGVRRSEIDLAFQAGELQFVVASAATAGVGFNWGHLNTMIFASLDDADDAFVQAYRRAIRGYRNQSLLIIVLQYENSVDQDIFENVDRKSKDANLVDETKEELFLAQKQKASKKLMFSMGT